MIDLKAAVLIVERELNLYRTDDDSSRYVVFQDLTLTLDWGWVLYYGTELELYTTDNRISSRSYAPFLVNRVTSELQQAGKAWPIEKYIEDYETRLFSLHQR